MIICLASLSALVFRRSCYIGFWVDDLINMIFIDEYNIFISNILKLENRLQTRLFFGFPYLNVSVIKYT